MARHFANVFVNGNFNSSLTFFLSTFFLIKISLGTHEFSKNIEKERIYEKLIQT